MGRLLGAVGCVGCAVGDGVGFWGNGVAGYVVRAGFLVEGDADVDEGFEGVFLAYEGGGAVVGVKIEEVEERFWYRR